MRHHLFASVLLMLMLVAGPVAQRSGVAPGIAKPNPLFATSKIVTV